MYKDKIMKIAYGIVASLVAVAVMINMVAHPVYAAEVESLPAYDIDITSSYDSDYVYVNDNGILYSIPRDTVASGSTVNSYPWSYPNTLEVCALGSDCPVSYWYSPSNKRIVVVSSSRTVGNENLTYTGDVDYSYFVRSYSDGTFRLHENIKGSSESGCPIYITIWDCITNTRYYGGLVYQSNSAIQNFSYTVDDNSGGLYDDLVCIFSSYEIKGFYEFSADSDVTTPDYYFDYQYLFYTEGIGYVFIDSSESLDYISNSSDPTKAILYFKDSCNKHVYISELGTTWYVDNSVSTMYGSTYTMDYSYFYDSAGGSSSYVLVYSNDDSYKDEPLVTPEYGDIDDIDDDLYDKDYIKNIADELAVLIGAPIPVSSITDDTDRVANFGKIFSYLYNKDFASIIDLINDDDYKAVEEWWNGRLQDSIYDNFTNSFFTRYELNEDGTFNAIEYVSLYSYVKALFEELRHLDLVTENMQTTLHNDLKSVFDNITNTNTYLYDIKGLLQDMPDYSKQLDKLTSIGSVGNDLTTTSNALLEEINNNILTLNTGSDSSSGGEDSSSSSSTTDITQDFLITLDDDMLLVLNEIDNSIDYMSGVLVSQSIEDTFDELFEDEDDEDWLLVSDFIDDAITVMTTNSVLSMAYSYGSSVTNGIDWLNERVETFYEKSGEYMPVITLAPVLVLVSVYLRKGGY